MIGTDQKLNSILYDNSNSYILNLKTRWNKNTNKILTLFTYVDGTTAELPYNKSFRGIYYVLVESVTLSKNGTWYINLCVDNVVVYKKPTITVTKKWI